MRHFLEAWVSKHSIIVYLTYEWPLRLSLEPFHQLFISSLLMSSTIIYLLGAWCGPPTNLIRGTRCNNLVAGLIVFLVTIFRCT